MELEISYVRNITRDVTMNMYLKQHYSEESASVNISHLRSETVNLRVPMRRVQSCVQLSNSFPRQGYGNKEL